MNRIRQRGFTLRELVAIVGTAAILPAVAIPATARTRAGSGAPDRWRT